MCELMRMRWSASTEIKGRAELVEVAGIEPASFDLVPEASPGAAGDLMSGPRRAPARYACPSPISFPLGTQALPRG